MTDKWEYMTKFIWASLENEGARDYIAGRWPSWKSPARHTPASMIPELNAWGGQGWELIHMEPVQGITSDGETVYTHEGNKTLSHYYFCVFKRRLPDDSRPAGEDDV